MKTIPTSLRLVISYVMKEGIPFQSEGKPVKNFTARYKLESPNGAKAIVEQILVSRERNESNRAGLWVSQSGIQLGKLTIWVSVFEIGNL